MTGDFPKTAMVAQASHLSGGFGIGSRSNCPMPDDESDRFEWRETYFVVFQADKRPLLTDVEAAVKRLRGHFRLTEPMAGDAGRIQSLHVVSPEEQSGLEIDHRCGVE